MDPLQIGSTLVASLNFIFTFLSLAFGWVFFGNPFSSQFDYLSSFRSQTFSLQ